MKDFLEKIRGGFLSVHWVLKTWLMIIALCGVLPIIGIVYGLLVLFERIIL